MEKEEKDMKKKKTHGKIFLTATTAQWKPVNSATSKLLMAISAYLTNVELVDFYFYEDFTIDLA